MSFFTFTVVLQFLNSLRYPAINSFHLLIPHVTRHFEGPMKTKHKFDNES